MHAFNEWTEGQNGSNKWWTEYFFECLISTCSLTVISYAVGLHTDTASKHPVQVLASVGSFIENKMILPVSMFRRERSDVPLGRGGMGNGVFVFAVIDHSLCVNDFTFHIDRGNPRRYDKDKAEFFNALVRAAQANNFQLPPRPSDVVEV